MRIPIKLIPQYFINKYKLQDKIHNRHVYCKIFKGIYGLPQAGKLENDLLQKRLTTCGYFECTHTPGLWKHIWRPVTFTLVVENSGVKFIGIEQLKHLIISLKTFYKIELDITGTKYCGITLECDYNNRTF